MIIFDEERPSDSPFVERIWRSHSERGGSFLSIAESRWEMVVTRRHGKITLCSKRRARYEKFFSVQHAILLK
jgi:hypothetical protein